MRDYAVMANAAIRRYQMALILIIETTLADYRDTVEQRAAKKHQNLLTELLMEQLRADGLNDLLMMGAGLWKHVFCISSYCVDAQKIGRRRWPEMLGERRKDPVFSLILF